MAFLHQLSPAAIEFLREENLHHALRTVAEARRSIARSFGCLAVCVCLPQPWGAAHVHADGRVTSPSGKDLPELTGEDA
jgi:hypothetical protein